MSNLLSSFSDLLGAFSEHKYLDDASDRANRIYAPVILMISASLLGLIQFFGDPIECTQDHIDAKADSDYIKTFCWANGTYNLQTDERLSYYQWVPVVLALQAFFFQVPYVFWSSLSQGSGLNLPSLMKGAFTLTEVQESSDKREGYRSEALYFINLIVQLCMINTFLNEDLYGYAFRSIFGIFIRAEWVPSGRFPLLGRCRFYNKFQDATSDDLENAKEYLCTLPLNMYNEKVFAGIVIMFIFLTVCVAVTAMMWIVRLFVPSVKGELVYRILASEKQDQVDRFMSSYLRTDGMVVLKLIRINMGVNTATEIISDVFARFKKMDEALVYSDSTSISNYSTLGGPPSVRNVDGINYAHPPFQGPNAGGNGDIAHGKLPMHHLSGLNGGSLSPTPAYNSRAPSSSSINMMGEKGSPVTQVRPATPRLPTDEENVPFRYREKDGSTV